MATITITNPTVPVEEPTPIATSDISLSGSGVVNVTTATYVNDGNIPSTISWSVSNIQNGTLTSFGSETTSVQPESLVGNKVIQPGQSIKFHLKFDIPAGSPGVVNPDCTADYTVQWV